MKRKKCFLCKKKKFLKDFSADSRKEDKKCSTCKPCIKKRGKKYWWRKLTSASSSEASFNTLPMDVSFKLEKDEEYWGLC